MRHERNQICHLPSVSTAITVISSSLIIQQCMFINCSVDAHAVRRLAVGLCMRAPIALLGGWLFALKFSAFVQTEA